MTMSQPQPMGLVPDAPRAVTWSHHDHRHPPAHLHRGLPALRDHAAAADPGRPPQCELWAGDPVPGRVRRAPDRGAPLAASGPVRVPQGVLAGAGGRAVRRRPGRLRPAAGQGPVGGQDPPLRGPPRPDRRTVPHLPGGPRHPGRPRRGRLPPAPLGLPVGAQGGQEVALVRARGQGRYHEVRYEELVSDPEAALRELLDFLGEPWDEAVLDYDRQPHDVQPRYAAFSSSRRVAAGERSAIYRSRVGAGHRELDPLLRLLVRLFGGATLRELGYR